MSGPPEECPRCGGETFDRQYTTGAGWRVSGYRCRNCGYRVGQSTARQAVEVVTLAAFVAAVATALKRRLG